MTKKITSFFQVSSATKNRKSGTVSGAKRDRNDDDCNGGNSAPVRSKCRIDSSLGHVNELLSFLSDDIGVNLQIENESADKESSPHLNHSWKNTLRKHFQSSSFLNLAAFVAREREIHKIYPPPPSIWSALNSCPLRNVKVVIVGQDPYHGIKQAHGLSFSVEPGCVVPPSLKNIFKELTEDPDVNFPRDNQPRHGHLIRWAKQGVLLLNAVLTVRDGQPNSHKNQGWEKVTDEIIRAVILHRCSSSSETPRGCVFLLWGKPATTKAMNIIETSIRDINQTTSHGSRPTSHVVIATSHPSPLGARKTDAPFLGSRCFSRCNQALTKLGHEPIDWNVD